MIANCEKDGRFHMEGGSWTNNLSWVQGYGNVLGPMEQGERSCSREKTRGVAPSEHRYRNALYYLLMTQTSASDIGVAESGPSMPASFPEGDSDSST